MHAERRRAPWEYQKLACPFSQALPVRLAQCCVFTLARWSIELRGRGVTIEPWAAAMASTEAAAAGRSMAGATLGCGREPTAYLAADRRDCVQNRNRLRLLLCLPAAGCCCQMLLLLLAGLAANRAKTAPEFTVWPDRSRMPACK
eukprot:COSAG01_NODE_7716_length_3086_cov_5.125544_6_plen_145_part_00